MDSVLSNYIPTTVYWGPTSGLERAYLDDILMLLDFFRGKVKDNFVNWEGLYISGFSSIRLNINTFPEDGGIPSFGYGRMVLFGPSFMSERFAKAILRDEYNPLEE